MLADECNYRCQLGAQLSSPQREFNSFPHSLRSTTRTGEMSLFYSINEEEQGRFDWYTYTFVSETRVFLPRN